LPHGHTSLPARPTDERRTDDHGKGIRLTCNRTRPASDATTVRVRNREVLLTDGPYAETKD
jgi:hypothetical protein